jgi:sortase A
MICAVHRVLRILSTALITAGLVVAADVGLTLAWKEPISSIYGSIQQREAERELEELERSFLTPEVLRKAAQIPNVRARVRFLAGEFAKVVKRGQGIGRIKIPEIDQDVVLVQGTDTASLQKGPGHYTRSDDPAVRAVGDGSAFPGQGKTVGIAGHRTTYLAPFRKLNELEKGDEVLLEMPYANFTYKLERDPFIVDPSAFRVVKNVDHERVTLTACHPLYSAAQRIVAQGRLTDISLFAPTDRIWQDP